MPIPDRSAGCSRRSGLPVAYQPAGIVVALTFIGLPFVVRTVEPVLAEVSSEIEEAALTLGASRLQTFSRVILPTIAPALATGFALAFARGAGEYGSVIFIAGNMPFKSEIAPLLIITQLEEYDYAGAAAIADGDADGLLRDAAGPQPAPALAAAEARLMRRASHLREPPAVKALLICGGLRLCRARCCCCRSGRC